MSEMIIVSACLAGINCRYNGTSERNHEIEKMVLAGTAVPLCPEVLGGLEIPRVPCEIVTRDDMRQVISLTGEDFTRFFQLGAEKTLKIAEIIGAKTAILKSRSPSCGSGNIYDGSFSKKLIQGNGLTAGLLLKHNIRVLTDENYKASFKT